MEPKWWHGKVAYQIYPKSFCDSNGDGIGDLKGIISKLDYLQALGIDILWLSPIYPSPFVDQGYDIADYENIDPLFGNLDDFDHLVAAAKERNIDVIMDLVANHCSDQHPWFKKACADLNSEEAGYFYFVKGKNGKVPNNLRSYFGGSVWDHIPGHEDEDIFYSHYFAKGQPDLNWYNPKLREQVYKFTNFWLQRGVKGFRVDAILSIVKDLSFPDLPPDDTDGMCHAANMNARNLHQIGPFLNELKAKTFTPADSFTVGEVLTVTPESVKDFAGANGYFSTLFDLSAREKVESFPHYRMFPNLLPDDFAQCVFDTQDLYQKVDAFVAPIIENHDEPRGLSYYMPDYLQNAVGAKTIATFLMGLRGIPFIYQGQEIGMTNTAFQSIDEFDDLYAKNEYRDMLEHGYTPEQAVASCARHGRDNARTPMLWDDSANAGFTTGKPWMRVHQDYKTLNVKNQFGVPSSTFSYYQDLIKLRKAPEYAHVFTYGSFERVMIDQGLIAYLRTDKETEQQLLVIINTRKDSCTYDLSALGDKRVCKHQPQVLISANEATLSVKADGVDGTINLGCGGAMIVAL